jgi:uncharacterized membrane protein YoaK (UPF0700 family)
MSGEDAGKAEAPPQGSLAAAFRTTPIHPALAPALSFVAGFCDATSFIALDHLFVAHVTGNIIVIGAEAWVDSANILAKVIAIPVFILAAAITMLAVRWARRRGYHVLHAALYVEAALLFLFFLGCLSSLPRSNPLDWNDTVAGMLGVAAMGTQVALMRLALPVIAPTNFMTGTVVQVTLDIIHCAGRGVDDLPPEERRKARARAVEGGRRLIGFVAGAVIAGILYFLVGVWALLVPVAVVLAAAILHPRHR